MALSLEFNLIQCLDLVSSVGFILSNLDVEISIQGARMLGFMSFADLYRLTAIKEEITNILKMRAPSAAMILRPGPYGLFRKAVSSFSVYETRNLPQAKWPRLLTDQEACLSDFILQR